MTTIQALIDAINGLVAVIEFFSGAAFVLALLAITLKNERFSLYLISAIGTFAIGISFASSSPGISMVMLALSTYELIKFIEIIYESDSPSRGYSMFKKMYHRITQK